MQHDWTIRLEEPKDYDAVEFLTREAFWNVHTPGCDEHYLAHVLRSSSAFLPELDFVAEFGGEIIGNIIYTRAVIQEDDGIDRFVFCFGPLSVLPEWQKKGVGSSLVGHSLYVAAKSWYDAVLIYGDPAYYRRFGFAAAERYDIATPDGYYADPLQALELVPGSLNGVHGRFFEDAAFDVDKAKAEAFDKRFPQKEKRSGLASQLLFQQHLAMKKPRK